MERKGGRRERSDEERKGEEGERRVRVKVRDDKKRDRRSRWKGHRGAKGREG